MPAPFKPVIRDELDVSNFAEEFTEMDPTYSPAALPQNCDRIFQVGGIPMRDAAFCPPPLMSQDSFYAVVRVGRGRRQTKNGIMHRLLLSAAIFDILESSSEVLTVLKSLL